jgi:hypothetical protein
MIGGVTPIATGYVLAACHHIFHDCKLDLFPRQLGFSVKGGVVAEVHATRQFLLSMQHDQILVKLDFSKTIKSL